MERNERSAVARAFAPLTPVFNPLLSRVAGRRFVPLYALLRHRGRRSGRMYSTPVVAHREGDDVLIPMPFGDSAQWTRNLLAAGEGGLRWKGVEYALANPQVVPAWSGAPQVVGIRQALRARMAAR